MLKINKKDFVLLILIATLIFIIIYIAPWLKNIDPSILTLISGAVGFTFSKFVENIKESKQRIYEQKRIYYNELIKPFRDILKNQKLKSGKTELSNKEIAKAMDSAFDNILYASDEVILKYGKFRNISTNNQENNIYLTMKLFAELLLAMRKDLGNRYTIIDEIKLLKMFINMSEKDEEMYRKEFKKLS